MKTKRETVTSKPTETPKEKENVVLASGQAGDYFVQVVLKKGIYVDDEQSSDKGTYEGEYVIKVNKEGKEYSDLNFTYDNSAEGINLPKDEILQMRDYNGDGQMDFAIGQKLGSSAKNYQFFTVTKDGILQKLEGSIVADAGYYPLFKMKDGKILYRQYNQESGEYINKKTKIY